MQDANNVIRTTAPLPAIRLGTRDADVRMARAGLLLLVYTRILALLWLAEGVMHWTVLLSEPDGTLTAMSAQRAAAVFFFCVMDFVAAVGLWLAAPWGGVVWLVIIGTQVLSWLLLPGFWTRGAALMATDAVLVPIYLALAWHAGQAENRKA